MTELNVANPNWWPHRFDPARGHVHFIRATREDHRKAVFLTDEYLADAANPQAVDLAAAAAAGRQAPLHFVFHSAYCCSTLLARAFDLPGISMGLKEPQILNDLSGWRMRGAQPQELASVMASVLAILSRPFGDGEALVVKPSNLVNGLAGLMLHVRPDARAVFLHAPLRDFLGSIARKGMFGRLWVRELMVKQMREGLIDLGLEGEDYLQLTDLQAAAVGWLAQHALFAQIVQKFGASRVRTLDSTRLMAASGDAMAALATHFSLSLEGKVLDGLVNGPVFLQHSKNDEAFDADARDAAKREGEKLHADEIEKVHTWAEAVAQNAGISMALPAPLI
ncbi:hypothetical protein [Kordiimonas lacus]|uniref:Sulfotransferase family protein n=1 Tax=Kordiimonas lacus TaxID=637679 RepID=A0A1G6XYK5_9PROT|nr:hypothetical protein [Kordiimonas lacus]SDD83239.1 hypothetical protein SAMN04488071_1416 [Kordiimonas lacus]